MPSFFNLAMLIWSSAACCIHTVFESDRLEATHVIHHFNKSTRSFLSREIDLKSELFAILCHSFIYQPTARNRALTILTCIRQAGTNGLTDYEPSRRLSRRSARGDFRSRGCQISRHSPPLKRTRVFAQGR